MKDVVFIETIWTGGGITVSLELDDRFLQAIMSTGLVTPEEY
jgi:hypothetical protein